ncbi:MAG: 4Fe-4S binding protein [Thermofilaceae archaeon]|nr:4Fe-4S binding protein [Thermofilaceae archaeon]
MVTTFEAIKNFFRKRATILYPEEKIEPSATFRGMLSFERSLCIGCGLCWRVCPASAIKQDRDDRGVRPIFFLDRCIFCHICVEICPKKAIKASRDRGSLVMDKSSLRVK